MKKEEFEKEQLVLLEEISYVDLNGSTYYGRYEGNFDEARGAFDFKAKDALEIKKVYLKDVKMIFRSLED